MRMDKGEARAKYAESVREIGIWPPYEAFYLQSLLFHTNSIVRSEEILRTHEISEVYALELFQSIVLHSASLSRFFWPSVSKADSLAVAEIKKLRAERLRSTFRLGEDSPLADRKLRNAMEHFDERLDDFVSSLLGAEIVPTYVGPFDQVPNPPFVMFRGYDPASHELEVLGSRMRLAPLMNEIVQVHEVIVRALENGSRLPS